MNTQGEYTIVVRYNSRALRGPIFPYKKPEGTYRILALGDSYADGYSVEYDDLFTQTMLDQLKITIKKPIEIINSAVGGYDLKVGWLGDNNTCERF